MNVPEDLRRHRLDLKARLISDAVTARHRERVFAAHPEVHQTAVGVELLVGVGDLGQQDVVVFAADDVAGPGQAHEDPPPFMPHFAEGENVKQFRMQRSSVDLEDQLRDPGSGQKRVHHSPSYRRCVMV